MKICRLHNKLRKWTENELIELNNKKILGEINMEEFNKLEREEIVGKINSQSFRKFFLPDLIESIFFPLLSLVQF